MAAHKPVEWVQAVVNRFEEQVMEVLLWVPGRRRREERVCVAMEEADGAMCCHTPCHRPPVP